jgi:hypothetical protein
LHLAFHLSGSFAPKLNILFFGKQVPAWLQLRLSLRLDCKRNNYKRKMKTSRHCPALPEDKMPGAFKALQMGWLSYSNTTSPAERSDP